MQFTCTTHLGHVLKEGDVALGCVTMCNVGCADGGVAAC